MELQTKNFGMIEVDEAKKITFEKGIPGFNTLHEYIIIEEENSVFAYLQSIEDGNTSFIITNPFNFKEDYSASIKEEYLQQLGGDKKEDYSIFVTVSVFGAIESATLNLVAPIIIHNGTKKGMQVILENTSYTTKHNIVELLEKKG